MSEIGASTANFYPELTENALEALLACGFRTLEVFINTESELNSEFIRDLRRKADHDDQYQNSIGWERQITQTGSLLEGGNK